MLGIALVAALALFVWGRWRYDLVALSILLILVIAGVIEGSGAFVGFAHPAVVTVAAVLVLSQGLRNSGVVDLIGQRIQGLGPSVTLQIVALTTLTAVASAFMNNVGALAIIMPVAIQASRSAKRSPSMVLMPIAFGSLLGGMMTLIGTPPNLIISSYRARAVGEAYGMFDFAWVGGVVTVVVVAACGLVLWRLLPRREPTMSRDAMFEIERYVAELRVGEESKVIGERIAELGKRAEGEFLVIGIARGERQIRMPSLGERVMAGDVLIVESEAETMKRVADAFGLEVSGDEKLREEFLTSGEVVLSECIVKADGLADGRTPAHLNLRLAFGVNLLGIARQGARVRSRVSQTRLRAGDVLLLQGDRDSMGRVLGMLGCLPLAERTLRLGQPRRVIAALGLFAAAIVCVVLGLLPVEIAFTACACVMVLAGLLSLREAYEAIDWPIIVLLAAMIPVGVAMETTGGAARVAEWMLGVGRSVPPWMAVALHMATCMALSNVINNAAAAVLMAPIAVGLSAGLGVSADPFLMATAIGASAAFLTPIGHQSNTLVMGPGGYRFTDYLRMGMPCTVLTLLVATPMILWRWPLEMAGAGVE